MRTAMNNRTHLGHTARKRFGQNFLQDEHVIQSIIMAIHPTNDDHLLEIGPGLAALTEPVADRIDHLTVIEIDRDLAERLKRHPFLSKKLTVIQEDAMQINFYDLSQKLGGKIRVFGNLPYNISTPLMFHLFDYVDDFVDMHFMLQKEVVNRLAAAPNSKTYGRLSVMAQYYCDIIPVLEVPPHAFKPAPKVDSAVVKLIPKTNRIHLINLQKLSQVTAFAFNQRRKSIRNSLQNLVTQDELTSLHIDLNARAENLSLQTYCAIANLVAQKELDQH